MSSELNFFFGVFQERLNLPANQKTSHSGISSAVCQKPCVKSFQNPVSEGLYDLWLWFYAYFCVCGSSQKIGGLGLNKKTSQFQEKIIFFRFMDNIDRQKSFKKIKKKSWVPRNRGVSEKKWAPRKRGDFFGLCKAKFASPYWWEIEVVVVFPLV